MLYYLLREDPEGNPLAAATGVDADDRENVLKVEKFPVEKVRQILSEIVESQEKMKAHMKALTKELLNKSLTFDQTYQRVQEVQPEDPLEKCGLSMMDFDQLLTKHQADPQVREGIQRIMSPADPSSGEGQGEPPSAARVIEVHALMLRSLEEIVRDFQALKNKEAYDKKTVVLAAQALIGTRVEEKFGLTSEEIERAVMANHTVLATDQEFAQVNMKMQAMMASLMDTGA